VAGQILTVSSTVLCAHSAPVSIVSTNARVLVGGQPVATLSDTYTVFGCAFTIGPKPQPCVQVRWLEPAMRMLIGGKPAILHNSTALCLSVEHIPQGQPTVVAPQPRVKAT
jgi:hypothetical protein